MPVKIQFKILKLKNPLTHVAIINSAIPLINCHALDHLTTLNKQYTKNMTIAKSNMSVINSNGFPCNDLMYDMMFSL